MAYSEALADRVRHVLSNQTGLTEKRMFGGLALMLHGRLIVGVFQETLMLRLGVDEARLALADPAVEPFWNGERPMPGWVLVQPDGFENQERLAGWISKAIDFVQQLPAK